MRFVLAAFGRYLRIMTCSVLLDLDGTLMICTPAFWQAALRHCVPLDMNRMKPSI